ncbi:transcription factor E2F8 isoform X2 [Ascaphus truei]|uniref:transcription factor E2F8 isoform X2 n=1 Tax=Ascaphus truei TaxID=8439 RepID=UPI003F597FAC
MSYIEIMDDEQKENNRFDPNKRIAKSPPRQTSHSVLGEIQSAVGTLRTPTKPKEVAAGDPWTPTANLKMLISAASPEIRNREREMLEEHFSGDEYEKTQPSRKEKSLGLLCHKFLARYPNYPNPALNNNICLDEVAENLHVERRRIYDIVNVLESLHMVSRLAKNKYIWHGRLNLGKTFDALKQVGEENKYAEQITFLKKREYEKEFDVHEDTSTETPTPRALFKQTDICFVELPGLEFRAASVNSRKEKSLRVMSQKFVMLFLVSTPQIVSLEVAAKILIGEDQIEDLDKSKFKTKIRRLYDIANVLSSLDLIKKVHVTEEKGRKPAFQWTGPEAFKDGQEAKPISSPTLQTSIAIDLRSPKEQCAKNLFASRGKQKFTRHQSLIKLATSIDNDRRKINSAPSSPMKTDSSHSSTNSSSIPSKMSQLAAICKQQLDQSKDPKRKLQMPKTVLNCTPNIEVKPSISSPCSSPSFTQTQGMFPFCQAIPLIHPHANSGTSYAIYLQPSQARTVTSQSPNVQGHLFPCAKGCGLTSLLEAKLDEGNMLQDVVTKGGGMSLTEDPPEKCSKRLPEPEDSSTSKRIKSALGQMENFPGTLYPSGYLIPLSHFASLGSEPVQDQAGSSPEHKIFTSPIAGVIPMNASELSNFPSLHMTPLNLMVSPGSVPAVPIVSQASQPVPPGHCVSSQSPSPAMFGFTLQNRDLISPGAPFSDGPQPVAVSPRNGQAAEELQAAQVLNFKHLSPVPYHGQPFTVFTLQQPSVPVTPKGSQVPQESFFRTPGGLTSSPTNSAASNHVTQGPVLVSQRKLDVGSEDTVTF